MEKIRNLKDLLVEQVRDLYNAEKQQINVLEEWSQQVTVRELRLAVKNHLDETHIQIKKLEEIFDKLNESPYGEICEPLKGLIKEANNLIERSADPEILDAGLITSIQHIKHYEIAGYGAACTYAESLGYEEVKDLLHDILVEIKEFDKRLTTMAKESINDRAKAPIIS